MELPDVPECYAGMEKTCCLEEVFLYQNFCHCLVIWYILLQTFVVSSLREQENEQNQHSGGARLASSSVPKTSEPEDQETQAPGQDSSEEQPAAMRSNFYTDELAMQAADNRTETIAESAAAGSEQEKYNPKVLVSFL